jgi:hypothetical protein
MIPKLPVQTNSHSFYVYSNPLFLYDPQNSSSNHVVLYSQPAMEEAGLPKSTFSIFAVSCQHLIHIYLSTAIFHHLFSLCSVFAFTAFSSRHLNIKDQFHPQYHSILQIGLHRPSRMIVSQSRDPTRCLDPSQLRSICLRNSYVLPLLCVMRRIRLWPLRAQRIPIAVSLGWRCHLLF